MRIGKPGLGITAALLAAFVAPASAGVIVGADGPDAALTGTDGADVIYGDPASGVGAPTSMTGITARKETAGTIQQANGDSSVGRAGAMSRDGRYVLVRTNAINIVGGSGAASPFQLMRLDLVTETWTTVSAPAKGAKSGDGDSDTGVFSPDGRTVYFATAAKNITGDPTPHSHVVAKDLATGAVTVLSRAPGGGLCPGNSVDPVLSPDGKKLAFSSDCAAFPGGDLNGVSDVFVMDVGGPLATAYTTIARVSAETVAGGTAGTSTSPVFAPAGTALAFLSASQALVDGDTGGTDVILKDLGPAIGGIVTGDVRIVSTDSAGGQVAGDCSGLPAFSPDGSRIAFTCAKALDAMDADGMPDVYVKALADHEAATCAGPTPMLAGTTLPLGVATTGGTSDPEFSPDGRWLVFSSSSKDLLPQVPDPSAYSTQVYRIGLGGLDCTAALVSRNVQDQLPALTEPATNPAFTPDGAGIVFESKASNLAIDFGTSVVAVFRAGLPTPVGGADVISALAGDDVIFGGAGNDLVDGGAGADAMNGGPGDDSYVVDNAGDAVVEGENSGADSVMSSVSFVLAGQIEALKLVGTAAINGTGGPEANSILGNTAANVILGDGGNDRLDGGSGNDRVDGGLGDDAVAGGLGNDVLLGGFGNDALGGGAGNDSLSGGDGNDRMDGGTGNDGIAGGVGNDLLVGGPGRDRLTGGAGSDIHRYLRVSDSPRGALRRDTITDLNVTLDKVDLRPVDANPRFAGRQAFVWGRNNRFNGRRGELRYLAKAKLLQGDVNGDRRADFEIRIVTTDGTFRRSAILLK